MAITFTFTFHFHQSDNFQETHWSQAFQMLSLRSEFQPKRSPRSAFEASPVIFPPFREEIKKVIIQRLTPVMAVIWLRSFLCCYTIAPKPKQTPRWRKSYKKKEEGEEEEEGPQEENSPKSWRKKRRDFFLDKSTGPDQAVLPPRKKVQFKSGAKKAPLVNQPGQWSTINNI